MVFIKRGKINMSVNIGRLMNDSGDEARLYLQVGSQEIDLKGSMREANDVWIRIKDQDTWASALSKIRIARQEGYRCFSRSDDKTRNTRKWVCFQPAD